MARKISRRKTLGPLPRWVWIAGIGLVLITAFAASASPKIRKRRVSVWWDIGGRTTVRNLDRYTATLKALGITGVVVMLNESGSSQLMTSFSAEDLTTFAEALRANHIELGLDTWIRPSLPYVEALPDLFPLATRIGARFIEFDTEGDWSKTRLSGYGSLEDAAANIAQVMARSPVPWGITTHPGKLTTTALILGQYGSFVVPQAYSRVGTDEPNGALPGSYQIRIFKRTREAYGDMPIVMGLLAFDQEWPGMDPAVAMLDSAHTSFGLGVDEVRFWSWKWIGGGGAVTPNRYAYDALAALRSEVVP